jgi:hypothetical protein
MIEELEAGGEIEDIDLTAEEWAQVNPAEIAKRYEMIRRYANFKLNKMKEDNATAAETYREKITKLKNQFYEHKNAWETEKLVLTNLNDLELAWDRERSGYIDKVDVLVDLQQQATELTDQAMRQMAEMIQEDALLVIPIFISIFVIGMEEVKFIPWGDWGNFKYKKTKSFRR